MFVEVRDADLEKNITLGTIPQSFKISVCEEVKHYKLQGVINFRPPFQKFTRNIQRKSLTENKITPMPTNIGHYTAICPRPGNKWSEYDDIPATMYTRSPLTLCCPSLLIYSVQSKSGKIC